MLSWPFCLFTVPFLYSFNRSLFLLTHLQTVDRPQRNRGNVQSGMRYSVVVRLRLKMSAGDICNNYGKGDPNCRLPRLWVRSMKSKWFSGCIKKPRKTQVNPYFDNDLMVWKLNSAPQAAVWIWSVFGKLSENFGTLHIRFRDLRQTYVKPTTKN